LQRIIVSLEKTGNVSVKMFLCLPIGLCGYDIDKIFNKSGIFSNNLIYQTYHHFHPRLISLSFGCVSQVRLENIGFSNQWRSKDVSQYLAPKIHLNLLQNIVGIVKNAQVQCKLWVNFEHRRVPAGGGLRHPYYPGTFGPQGCQTTMIYTHALNRVPLG
jgi:hypothetical protein